MEEVSRERYPAGVDLEVSAFACTTDSLRGARELVEQFSQDVPLDKGSRYKLSLAVEEACANAVTHGSNEDPSKEFVLGLGRSGNSLVITVRDAGGKTFDPQYFADICKNKTWGLKGGRGIFLMGSVMDEVMYVFDGGKSTTVCMIKYLQDTQDAPPPDQP